MSEPQNETLPVSVLTGFLGSGKTTLLRHLLAQPAMARVAVVINEFGEIGLDHLLVERVDERTLLLSSGCLCCTVRDDLTSTLKSLARRRAKGEVPDFDRVVIETTGLADPAPILHTLMRDAGLGYLYRLDGVITAVDAVVGAGTLDRHGEAVKQAAVADRLILTKCDLAPAHARDVLKARLKALNPAAPIIEAIEGRVDPALLFNAGLYNPKTKSLEVRRWLKAEAYGEEDTPQHHHDGHRHDHRHDHDHGALDRNRHDDRIRAFCLTYDRPLEWDRFVQWAEMITLAHGADLLRLKGILNIKGEARPVVVHGVQHLFHPPAQLAAWPDNDRRSRLICITRDLDQGAFARTLKIFNEGVGA